MTYVAAFLAIGGFVLGLRLSRVVPEAQRAIATASTATRTLADPVLEDREKEQAVRQASIALFGSFGSILLRGAASLLLSLVPIMIFESTGLARLPDVTSLLLSWQVIVASSALLAAAALVWTKG